MKLTIYAGRTPITAAGKNQCRLLAFAEKYSGWHTYKSDRATTRAVNALQAKGAIEIIGDQFRFQCAPIEHYRRLHK